MSEPVGQDRRVVPQVAAPRDLEVQTAWSLETQAVAPGKVWQRPPDVLPHIGQSSPATVQ